MTILGEEFPGTGRAGTKSPKSGSRTGQCRNREKASTGRLSKLSKDRPDSQCTGRDGPRVSPAL